MPDLNLIDEGGFEEEPAAPQTAPPAKKSVKSSGGGSGKPILILVIIVCVLAGVGYLYHRGIIKMPGKKQQPVAQIQEEQFPPETPSQPVQAQKQGDTNEVALLDTAPVEEKAEAGKESESVKEPETKATVPTMKKTKLGKKNGEMMETEFSSKLSEMKGEFTIQVIAYREKKQAVETAKNLEFAGYPSFVEKIPMSGGDWYTVRIGRYSSRDEAKKAVKSFAEQLQSHYVIDKIRSK